MSMLEMKTSELEGEALDWAVWLAIRGEPGVTCNRHKRIYMGGGVFWSPSVRWDQCGPLIELSGVACDYARPVADGEQLKWFAQVWRPYGCGEGSTPLIAACRAIVAAKLGDTVNIPTELVAK